jgi:glutamine cyclotransferase
MSRRPVMLITAVVLLSSLAACGAPTSPAQATEPLASEPPPSTATAIPPTEPPERVQLDPCSLLSAAEVEPILGGPVQVQPAIGTGGCSYVLSTGDMATMTQLALTAAQGAEAKTLTLLGIGFLAGFSGDPNLGAEFEALNEELPDLSLLELINRLADLLQGTDVDVKRIDAPDGGGVWLLYQTEAYAQGTLILVRGDEYVSLTQIGGDMTNASSRLTGLGEIVFDRLPANFYLLDEDGDGSFSIELGGEADESTEEPTVTEEPPEAVSGLVWVSAANSGLVYAIDPNVNQITSTLDVGRFPTDVAVAGGNVWVVSDTEGTVWRIDPDTLSVVETIRLNGNTLHLDSSADALWVVGGLGVRMVDLGTGSRYGVVTNRCYDVTIGGDFVWVSQTQDQQILQIDPSSRRVVGTIKLDGQPTGVLFAHGYLWTVLSDPKELLAIDPASGDVAHLETYRYIIHGMTADADRLWYSGPTALFSIEPGTWATDAFAAANPPSGISFYAGSLWATSPNEGVITRYDPQTGEVQAVIEVGSDPGGIAAGE